MTSELLFEFDRSFNTQVIGTDEAGRGPAAGGVFAAAVMFEKVTEGLIKDLAILNDSKKLTAKKRESIYDIIKNNTLNKIVCVEVEEIEKINILNASLKAMNIACSAIVKHPETLILVDGNKLIKNFEYNQQYVIKGDPKPHRKGCLPGGGHYRHCHAHHQMHLSGPGCQQPGRHRAGGLCHRPQRPARPCAH